MMDQRIVDDYFNGVSIEAYKIFGAHLCEKGGVKGVRFTTYAPHALSLCVIGEFNGWSDNDGVMQRVDDRGIYSVFIKGVKAGMLYKYRVKQATGRIVDKMDPYAFFSELRPQTASITSEVFKFKWADKRWMNRRDKNYNRAMNIYELHIGSWHKKDGEEWVNYQKIAEELITYVKENNFTHIEFMPLNEYPFDGSWGYQSSGYFAVTSRYGKCAELVYLINECHKANIGVIMDFVPVHFVRDDFSLGYFDGTPLYEYDKEEDALSQWGSYNFNLGKEEVRSFLMSAAGFWMDIYHIDGIRMDAISNIIHWHGNKDLGENTGAIEFVKRMNTQLGKTYPSVMLIAEDSSDFPRVTKKCNDGGLGFDYKWDLGWMNDTLKYLERDPIHRKWHHHALTFSMQYFYSERFLMVFSHDEVVHGKKTILNKMWGSYEQQFAQLKTLYLYMFAHPGKKLNFMGNEFAHFREWDEERSCDWELLQYPAHDAFHQYFKELGNLYLGNKRWYEHEYEPASFTWLDVNNEDENLYSFIRSDKDGKYIVILNFSPNKYDKHKFEMDFNGEFKEILNSDMEIYGGSVKKHQLILFEDVSKSISVDVPAFGGLVIAVEKIKSLEQQNCK